MRRTVVEGKAVGCLDAQDGIRRKTAVSTRRVVVEGKGRNAFDDVEAFGRDGESDEEGRHASLEPRELPDPSLVVVVEGRRPVGSDCNTSRG